MTDCRIAMLLNRQRRTLYGEVLSIDNHYGSIYIKEITDESGYEIEDKGWFKTTKAVANLKLKEGDKVAFRATIHMEPIWEFMDDYDINNFIENGEPLKPEYYDIYYTYVSRWNIITVYPWLEEVYELLKY